MSCGLETALPRFGTGKAVSARRAASCCLSPSGGCVTQCQARNGTAKNPQQPQSRGVAETGGISGEDNGERRFGGSPRPAETNVLVAVAGWMQEYRQARKRQQAAVCPKRRENCQARNQPGSLMERDVRLQLQAPRLDGWRSNRIDASVARDKVVDRRRPSQYKIPASGRIRDFWPDRIICVSLCLQ